MSSDRSRRRAQLGALGIAIIPATAGLLLSWAGERSSFAALLLLAEPALLCLALYVMLWLAWERRLLFSLSALSGVIAAGLALHRAPTALPLDDPDPAWAADLQACLARMPRGQAPVRLLSWTLSPTAPLDVTPTVLAAHGPDLVVLRGLSRPGFAASLGRRRGAEVTTVPGEHPEQTTALIARDGFLRCGDAGPTWTLALPTAQGDAARMVVAFAKIRDVGVVPLISVTLDRPSSVGGWGDWPRRLLLGARRAATVSRTIAPDRTLLVGDLASPRTFRQVTGLFLGAGLEEIAIPATWPTRLGRLPMLPLHAFDRMFAGRQWRTEQVRVLASGVQPRSPVLVELAPTGG